MYNISFFLFYLSFLITTSSLSLQFVTFRIFVIFLSPPPPPCFIRVTAADDKSSHRSTIAREVSLRDRRIFAFSFVCFFFLFFFTRTSPEYTPPFISRIIDHSVLPNYFLLLLLLFFVFLLVCSNE